MAPSRLTPQELFAIFKELEGALERPPTVLEFMQRAGIVKVNDALSVLNHLVSRKLLKCNKAGVYQVRWTT